MYSIKVKRGTDYEVSYPCTHFAVTRYPEGSEYGTGIVFELVNPNRMVKLPDDGDTVYVMNALGNTVGTYRYPDVKKAEFRATATEDGAVTDGAAATVPESRLTRNLREGKLS